MVGCFVLASFGLNEFVFTSFQRKKERGIAKKVQCTEEKRRAAIPGSAVERAARVKVTAAVGNVDECAAVDVGNEIAASLRTSILAKSAPSKKVRAELRKAPPALILD